MNLINESSLRFNLLHCIILPFMATEKYTALKQLGVKPLKILEMDCTRLKQFIWQNLCPFGTKCSRMDRLKFVEYSR